jgi:hypothetical protein
MNMYNYVVRTTNLSLDARARFNLLYMLLHLTYIGKSISKSVLIFNLYIRILHAQGWVSEESRETSCLFLSTLPTYPGYDG